MAAFVISTLVIKLKAECEFCEDAEARDQPLKRREIILGAKKSQRSMRSLREVHLLTAARGYIKLQSRCFA